MLLGAPPDKQLMEAADRKELGDPDRIKEQVQRMLKDPRARKRSEHFAYDWLHLERLRHIAPDKKRFPEWNSQLAGDMRAETIAFFNEVIWQQERPLADLFNAQFTYVTQRLAEHYRFSADDGKPSGETAKTRPERTPLPAMTSRRSLPRRFTYPRQRPYNRWGKCLDGNPRAVYPARPAARHDQGSSTRNRHDTGSFPARPVTAHNCSSAYQ